MTESKEIFTRRASGLVRQASTTDLLIIGLFNAGPFLLNIFLIPLYISVFPGANLPLAALIGGGLAIATQITYAAIGSTMPRAGGDYVYQSRGIAAFIGFSQVMGILLILAFTLVTASPILAIAQYGLSTMASFVGAATNNQSLMNIGSWLYTPYAVEIVTIIALIIAFFNALGGVNWLRRIQRYVLIPLLVISGLAVIYIFATTSSTTFLNNFNSFGSAFGVTNLHDTVLKQAANNGYATPTFNWLNTFYVSLAVFSWAGYSISGNYLLGEVKGAGVFKNLSVAYIGGSLISVIGFIFVETLLVQNVVGWNFLNAVSFVGQFEAFGAISNPVMPFYPAFSAITAIAAGSPVLIILGLIGYIAAGYYIILWSMVAMSRVLVAMSLDGIVPRFFSNISERFYSPRNAILFMFVLFLIVDSIFALDPSAFLLILNGTIPASMTNLCFTSIAVVLFPFTQKRIFSAGPVAKYRNAMIVIAVISSIITGIITALYFIVPGYGIGWIGAVIMLASFLGSAAWYFGYKAYQKRRGIDVSLAFQEIPPE